MTDCVAARNVNEGFARRAPCQCLLLLMHSQLGLPPNDLLNVLDAIGNAGATFRSLGDTWADTTTPAGKLMLTRYWEGWQSMSVT